MPRAGRITNISLASGVPRRNDHGVWNPRTKWLDIKLRNNIINIYIFLSTYTKQSPVPYATCHAFRLKSLAFKIQIPRVQTITRRRPTTTTGQCRSGKTWFFSSVIIPRAPEPTVTHWEFVRRFLISASLDRVDPNNKTLENTMTYYYCYYVFKIFFLY